MAIKVSVKTIHGETRELYVRLNNVEASNHGVSSNALFRGFVSQEAFENGSHYIYEEFIKFFPNVDLPLWQQAYDALKSTPGYEGAVDC